MIRSTILVVGLVFLFIGYGCSPVGVLASGGATTMVVAEGDKSLGTAIDDATIKLNISRKFLISENNLFINIDTSVVEGMVLLTGIVTNQESRIEAVKIVWEVEGVKEVINEIDIGDKTLEVIKNFGLDKSGYRLITNDGKNGNQEIPHFHIHILGGENLGGLR